MTVAEATTPLAVLSAEPLEARSEPVSEANRPAPFPLNLRGQATGTDARAERLIRQIRAEVETLRTTLDEMVTAQDDMVAIDLDAVVADPDAAAALPPAILVRGLVSASERISSLNSDMASINDTVKKLESINHDLQLEHSFNRGRLETLDEVIAALHGNLQDLRFDRDQRSIMMNGHAQLPANIYEAAEQ